MVDLYTFTNIFEYIYIFLYFEEACASGNTVSVKLLTVSLSGLEFLTFKCMYFFILCHSFTELQLSKALRLVACRASQGRDPIFCYLCRGILTVSSYFLLLCVGNGCIPLFNTLTRRSYLKIFFRKLAQVKSFFTHGLVKSSFSSEVIFVSFLKFLDGHQRVFKII